MTLLLDTNVAIHLRDGDDEVAARISLTREPLILSIVTVVELEAGIAGPEAERRRARLDLMTTKLEVRPFGLAEARTYGEIVTALGYSRREVLDRMIAAQALTAGAALATLNATDFRDIPGLRLLEW